LKKLNFQFNLGIGDWGLGIGGWGFGGLGRGARPKGPHPNPQTPIPNPQSPIPIFNIFIKNFISKKHKNLIYFYLNININF